MMIAATPCTQYSSMLLHAILFNASFQSKRSATRSEGASSLLPPSECMPLECMVGLMAESCGRGCTEEGSVQEWGEHVPPERFALKHSVMVHQGLVNLLWVNIVKTCCVAACSGKAHWTTRFESLVVEPLGELLSVTLKLGCWESTGVVNHGKLLVPHFEVKPLGFLNLHIPPLHRDWRQLGHLEST